MEIKKAVENFAKNALLGFCQRGKCFTTCYPLSVYLENLGVENSMMMGHYKIKDNIHYWLILADDKLTVKKAGEIHSLTYANCSFYINKYVTSL